MTPEATITDFAGNTFLASRLEELESPGFDPHGAAKDRAWQTLGKLADSVAKELPKKDDRIRVKDTGPKKLRGSEGVVFWRGKQKQFGYQRRYGSDMEQTLSKALGHDDRLGVRRDDGTVFWVDLIDAEKMGA